MPGAFLVDDDGKLDGFLLLGETKAPRLKKK